MKKLAKAQYDVVGVINWMGGFWALETRHELDIQVVIKEGKGGTLLTGDAKLVYETHRPGESIIANLVLKTD